MGDGEAVSSNRDNTADLSEEMAVIARVHHLDVRYTDGIGSQLPAEDRQYPSIPPKFMFSLPNNITIWQYQGFHLETRVDPFNDGTMVVNWVKDDKPVLIGTRVNIIFDRGFTLFDIAYCYTTDSGTYKCIAINDLGVTESNPVTVIVVPDNGVLTKSNLSDASICSLQRLENNHPEINRQVPKIIEPQPPVFIEKMYPAEVQMQEGGSIEFCAIVNLGTGQNVEFEWFKDEVKLHPGARVVGTLEMNHALLKIRYIYAKDTGSYHCVVTTENGTAKSSHVVLQCDSDQGGIDRAPQMPGDKIKGIAAVEALEAILNHSGKEGHDITDEEEMKSMVPEITSQLEQVDQLEEHGAIHFEVKYRPFHDSSLFIEWFKNEKPLTTGSRFVLVQENGYASLDICYTVTGDSGNYWCMAKNKDGQVESNRIIVECLPSDSIVTTSNIQEDSEGYRRIRQIESDNKTIRKDPLRDDVAKSKPESAPSFEVHPMPVTTEVGGPAKFLVRCRGNPRPVIEWFLNEEPVKTYYYCRVYDDGAINYLDLNRCEEAGEIQIRVVASNRLGQAETSTSLIVIPMEDFRPHLHRIVPNYNDQIVREMKSEKITLNASTHRKNRYVYINGMAQPEQSKQEWEPQIDTQKEKEIKAESEHLKPEIKPESEHLEQEIESEPTPKLETKIDTANQIHYEEGGV